MSIPTHEGIVWSDAQPLPEPGDGYSHWEAATKTEQLRAVMVFAELRESASVTSLRDAILALQAEPMARMQASELDALDAEIAALDEMARGKGSSEAGDLSPPPPAFPWPVRVAVFWLGALDELPDYCRLIHVGPRVARLNEADPRDRDPIARHAATGRGTTPIIAAIDDGIGYLNARFRRSLSETRIEKIWLQSEPRGDTHGVVEPLPDVRIGQVLTRRDIDRELATGLDEDHLYRMRNAGLLPRDVRHSTDHRAAHGTHVLDLAAGAECTGDDPLRDLPILAVQLPPAAIAETSGRKTEGYVAIGLRWIVTEAMRASTCDGRPVVVNLSLGALGGPGDETAFLAEWCSSEIARYERLTGGRLQIVAAYGNARLDQLVARKEVCADAPLALDWRIQPDDRTASFLELRAPGGGAGKRVSVTVPDPRIAPLVLDWPDAGQVRLLQRGRHVIAALYSVSAPAGGACLVLAVAPTARWDDGALAPAGAWKLSVESAASALVTAEVLRDDTPYGFRPRGRQSYLDAPGWDWDAELGGNAAPAFGNPISRQGTAVAYAGATSAMLWFVSAAGPATGQPGAHIASRYSAEGISSLGRPGQSVGPTLSARGDDGVFLTGQRASGVLTGSVARFSGTSVAAPRVSRALASLWARQGGSGDPEADLMAILGDTPPLPRPDPRLGRGTLHDHPHSRSA
ncbi:Subtilase family protein [Roseivivax halotolerans]|uniref:Subtilase family protein n=1 Tax=Roseivivax halotolerans TaxID=93684 RepID=A0A1I5ZTG5_9RHOB|nr:S8 family serine peptidase [Roseivivax halotolerans]SFQ59764.1 Subtilase family protein [Roseivivax halotolerans]